MTEVNSKSIIKDKQLAEEIIGLLLDRATQVDYVLELVATSFIIIDEQLANKLHLAMAKTTTNLLQHKQDVIDSSKNIMPIAYSRKLDELSAEDRLGYLLDICRIMFPSASLETHSRLSKNIFDDTIACIDNIIRTRKLTKKNHLLYLYNSNPVRLNYLKMLVENNNMFKD